MDLEYAREVLRTESDAIRSLIDRIGESFKAAAERIRACEGHVVVSGMGKAGLVGLKISATLASTGTPSHFVHPAEAVHGDLGRIMKKDVLLALSNSGESEELLRLIPKVRELGAAVVSLTASAESSLGRVSDVVVELGRIEEACPLGLAPSASTTALLALGDALALCVQKARGFNQEDYAFFHPAGELGRKLQKVGDVMRTGDRNPIVREETPVTEALARITRARAGAVSVTAGDGTLAGIFTDGDLRRLLSRNPQGLAEKIGAVMTRTPTVVGPDQLVADALRILREKRIDELPVVNGRGEPVGMLDIQDVLGAGV
ncbi:MAG TPA: KpsF/GutQ family sugar-phosphate isomerase [Planctomycetota bacterium]|nr:KpsF/GutQ family sugar-phosphate isomerase [Planctomycetota bacterium]